MGKTMGLLIQNSNVNYGQLLAYQQNQNRQQQTLHGPARALNGSMVARIMGPSARCGGCGK